MKLARWGVDPKFATTGGGNVNGAIYAHVFTDDSNAPICQPSAGGTPSALYASGGAWHCIDCRDRLDAGWWATTTFGSQRLWVACYEPTARPGVQKIVDGVAGTDAEAFDAAREALARVVPHGKPIIVTKRGEAAALKVARERRAEQRALKISAATGAQVVEYVYRHHKKYRTYFDLSFTWETEKAKVLRKTAKKLFVQDVLGTYTTDGGVMVLKTYALDRAALARGKHRYGWTLNPNPPADGIGPAPGWAEVLGLNVPCTAAEAKAAFRRAAKASHPDNGGTAEAFQRVTTAYKAAAQSLGAS